MPAYPNGVSEPPFLPADKRRQAVRSLASSAEQPQPCTIITPQASTYSKHTADKKLKIQNTAASGRNLFAYRV